MTAIDLAIIAAVVAAGAVWFAGMAVGSGVSAGWSLKWRSEPQPNALIRRAMNRTIISFISGATGWAALSLCLAFVAGFIVGRL